VLHLYTLDRGRVGAVAKGIRRTKSRFGARLEPLSHAELLLHQGSGELQTVTGVDLIESHRASREDPYRLSVGLIGLEAMLRLFTEQEANPRAFRALTRFLELLDGWAPATERSARPGLDPLALSFQLKLLWLSGYSPRAGGAVCAACRDETTLALAAEGLNGIEALLRRPLAEAGEAGLSTRATRDALAVVNSSHEFHGGF